MLNPEITVKRLPTKTFNALGKLGQAPHTERALMQGGLIIERATKQNITTQGLIDTGKMRSSVAALVEEWNKVVVAVRVYYAFFHEFGTRFLPARPFLRPALDENREDVARAVANYFADQLRKLR